MKHLIFVDGSSLGNPGPAGIGVSIYDAKYQDHPKRYISKSIGIATNNEAEYTALIEATMAALQMRLDDVIFFSDSQLVVKQVNGGVKCEHLKPLCEKAQNLLKLIQGGELHLISRRKNVGADALANRAARQAEREGKK